MRSNIFLFLALYALSTCNSVQAADAITYHVYRGKEVTEKAHHWPPLSIALTYDYPYLYVGKAEDEDVEQFSTDRSVAVLAQDGEQVIGIAIGTPVDSGKGHSKSIFPLIKHDEHYTYGKGIYIVEILVDKPYQRRGIARTMMQLFAYAAAELEYTDMYLITVERSAQHPFKTPEAPDLDVIWERLNFRKTHFTKPHLWPTRCGVPGNEHVALVDNMIRLWHKRL